MLSVRKLLISDHSTWLIQVSELSRLPRRPPLGLLVLVCGPFLVHTHFTKSIDFDVAKSIRWYVISWLVLLVLV